ncbi:hypothetical protein DPMN_015114 [Dreissena polymorpha]|uniref:Uncharacterized protein n=1 Tax=Dreissena polymorpha TaxID=45954 RepID=A0A9D4NAL7_DREPO|nr:hypothetical protein DPMN_015114 [Dreissena polymorpha]
MLSYIVGNPVALLDGYYEMFGDKYCCFSDIRTYLEILNESEQTKVCRLAREKCDKSDRILCNNFIANIYIFSSTVLGENPRYCHSQLAVWRLPSLWC